jgi:type IV fimbrial biogenesis protein FimT
MSLDLSRLQRDFCTCIISIKTLIMHRVKKIDQTQGLTLIEVIVVLGILAILAGMSASNLGDYIPDYQLRQAAQDLYSNMHFAKMEAIKRNEDVKIIFDVSGSSYTISLENGDSLVIVNLSKYGNTISYGIGNADYKGAAEESVTYDDDSLYFEPDGICNKNGYVYITNTKGNTYAVGSLQSGIIVIFKWVNASWNQ